MMKVKKTPKQTILYNEMNSAYAGYPSIISIHLTAVSKNLYLLMMLIREAQRL